MRGEDPEHSGSGVRNVVHRSRIGSLVQAHTINELHLHQAAPEPTTDATAKAKLAELVRAQWSDESSLRDLDGDRHIPARAEEHRRLVVLGGAGTGKTSFAVALLRALVVSREPEDPVPVLVSAAGWEVDEYPDVRGWLVAQLERTYAKGTGLRPEALAALVARGHVLLVLDGLDEMPADARAAGITALNSRFPGDHQLIVTCRSEEYRQGGALGSALVVEPERLSPEIAADYLERVVPDTSPDWAGLLAAVRAGTAGGLGEIVTTAFGLWLVGVAGAGVDLDVVRNEPDHDVVRVHLLDRLVPVLVQRRRPDLGSGTLSTFRRKHMVAAPSVTLREHDPADVEFALGLLADYVGEQPFAWWELAEDVRRARGSRWVRTTFASLFGLIGAVCTGLSAHARAESPFFALMGAALGAGVGLLGARATRRWGDDSPAFADFRLRGRGLSAVSTFLGTCFACGIMVPLGLLTGQSTPTIISWIVICLVFGLSLWIETPLPDGTASTPMGSWRADRRVNVIRWLLVGSTAAMLGTIGMDLAFIPGMADAGLGDDPYLTIGVMLCGTGFLLTTIGDHRAWMGYLLATTRLAVTRSLPRDLMPFLDDAHRMGLLRAVGPVYEFRHEYVRRYLAAKYKYWVGGGEG